MRGLIVNFICGFIFGVVVFLSGEPAAHAQILLANFDSFSEGFQGASVLDGGITFSNLVALSGETTFSIEATSNPDFQGHFSAPNYLVPGGFAPGPGSSLGDFTSLSIAFAGPAKAASLDLLVGIGTGGGNTISLEAFFGSNLVATSSFLVPSTFNSFQTLSISGVTFDSLKLVSSGPSARGDSLIGVDDVSVSLGVVSVPEPVSQVMLLGSLVFLGVCLWYKRRRLV